MPPPCRTPPGQKPGYPPGPAPIAPLMAMVSMPLWLDDTSTAVRGYSSSWSPPDTSRAPFPHRSPRRSSANAACGGLKPPPDRRLRRAKPSSPTEHRFLKVLPTYIQTPIPRSWRTSGGPCTTPLRCSPHRSFQGADTHQRDSALPKYGVVCGRPPRTLRSRRFRSAAVGTDTGQRMRSRRLPRNGADHVFRFARSACGPVVAMKSSRVSTTVVGDSTCGKCPTPGSTSSRLSGRASWAA